MVLRASLAASSSLEPESAWALLLQAPGGWNGARGLPPLRSGGWGRLAQPHSPDTQMLPPPRDKETKVHVGGTQADAKNAEPGSTREGTRPTCRRACGTRPSLGEPGRLGERSLPETRALRRRQRARQRQKGLRRPHEGLSPTQAAVGAYSGRSWGSSATAQIMPPNSQARARDLDRRVRQTPGSYPGCTYRNTVPSQVPSLQSLGFSAKQRRAPLWIGQVNRD